MRGCLILILFLISEHVVHTHTSEPEFEESIIEGHPIEDQENLPYPFIVHLELVVGLFYSTFADTPRAKASNFTGQDRRGFVLNDHDNNGEKRGAQSVGEKFEFINHTSIVALFTQPCLKSLRGRLQIFTENFGFPDEV